MKPASVRAWKARKGNVVAHIIREEDGCAYTARTETFQSVNAAKKANGPNSGDGTLPFPPKK